MAAVLDTKFKRKVVPNSNFIAKFVEYAKNSSKEHKVR